MVNDINSWLKLSRVAEMAQGHLHGADIDIASLSTDTRNVGSGDLFVALEGEHFDGHAFINAELEQLARAVLVHKRIQTALPSIVVDDTLAALTRWAKAWRNEVAPGVVAVTGSNGKTTVKQMLSNVLSLAGSTCYTQGNLNNHIGVPLTLLTMREHNQYAVIEMGANHFGEIDHLSNLVAPDVAVITNAGPAHLEGFGSVAGVAQGKGEIMNGLGEGGVIVLNADDEYLSIWQTMATDKNLSVVTFGFSPAADVRAHSLRANNLVIEANNAQIEVKLPLPGKHNASNALAVAAAALQLGVDMTVVKQGLESAHHVNGRLQTRRGQSGATILDDTYNANPASLMAAIDVLCEQAQEPWLVIGDMGEMGADAEQIHARIGADAKAAGIKKLFALGELTTHTVASFGDQAFHFDGYDELSKELAMQLSSECCVLVKGSRAMHMEDIVKRLLADATVH